MISKKSNKIKVVSVIVFIILLVSAVLSVCIPLLNQNDNSNKNNNQTQTESSVDFSTLTMASIGDSITLGLCKGVAMSEPYPNLVEDELGLSYVYNLGIGGSTIYNKNIKSMVNRFTNIPNDVDIISLMGGVNDWAQNVPLGTINDNNANTIYGALNYISTTLKSNYPNAFIFYMSPLPVSDAKLNEYSATEYSLADVSQAFKNIGAKYDIPILDLYSLSGFEDVCNDSNATDGVHPNQEFHKENLAPLITQFIKDNYK